MVRVQDGKKGKTSKAVKKVQGGTKEVTTPTGSSCNFAFTVNHYVDLEDPLMHDDISLQGGETEVRNGKRIALSMYQGKPLIDGDGKLIMIWDPRIIIPAIPEVKYFICQSEIAPETKRPHLQCYLELDIKTTSKVCQKLLKLPHDCPSFRIKCRARNITYCSKSKSYDPRGIRWSTDDNFNFGKGRRTDLEKILKEIQGGLKRHEILAKYPHEFNMYSRFITEACFQYLKPRTTYPNLIIRYGVSGSGKSSSWFKLQREDKDQVYVVPFKDNPSTLWFDGYHQQKYCIFEEFSPNKVSLTELLTFLDMGMKAVEVKGGFTQFDSENIIITTNVHPLTWYEHAKGDHRLGLIRRIADLATVYFHEDGVEPEDRTQLFKDISKKYKTSPEAKLKRKAVDESIYANYNPYSSDVMYTSDVNVVSKIVAPIMVTISDLIDKQLEEDRITDDPDDPYDFK